MKSYPIKSSVLFAALSMCQLPAIAETDISTLTFILNDDYRTPTARGKDADLKPLSTLAYFGIEPDMHVMEIWPNDGWYTEILAPYLKQEGQLTTAIYDPESRGEQAKIFELANIALKSRLLISQEWFGNVGFTHYEPASTALVNQAQSTDMILSFDDSIAWTSEGTIRSVFEDAYAALRPGGVFGVVDNLKGLPDNSDLDIERYPSLLARMAEEVGFTLVGSSNVKALTPQVGVLAAYEHENVIHETNTGLGDDLNSVSSSIVNSKHFILKFVKVAKIGTLVDGNSGVTRSTLAGSR